MAVAAVLLATSGRYGYHRDELYFLRAGQHPAFGYLDQPPLTPLLARAASELFGDSLVGLRLASALAAALVVLLTGLIAREFGGGRGPQALAAGCMAVSAILLAVGHLLSTSTFDLLAWSALSWLVVRALRDGGWGWLAVGLVTGIGLQNKTLVAFLPPYEQIRRQLTLMIDSGTLPAEDRCRGEACNGCGTGGVAGRTGGCLTGRTPMRIARALRRALSRRSRPGLLRTLVLIDGGGRCHSGPTAP